MAVLYTPEKQINSPKPAHAHLYASCKKKELNHQTQAKDSQGDSISVTISLGGQLFKKHSKLRKGRHCENP